MPEQLRCPKCHGRPQAWQNEAEDGPQNLTVSVHNGKVTCENCEGSGKCECKALRQRIVELESDSGSMQRSEGFLRKRDERIAELENALAPFAEVARAYLQFEKAPDEKEVLKISSGSESWILRVANFKRAARVFEKGLRS